LLICIRQLNKEQNDDDDDDDALLREFVLSQVWTSCFNLRDENFRAIFMLIEILRKHFL